MQVKSIQRNHYCSVKEVKPYEKDLKGNFTYETGHVSYIIANPNKFYRKEEGFVLHQ